MTDKEKQAIKYFYNLRATIDESYMLFDEKINVKCGKETIKQISVVLNLIEKQQSEIDKYTDMYAVSVADRVNSAFKQEHKNNEDLEMLYKGCQIELEEKDKIIDRMADFMWDYDCCSNFPQEYCKDCCDLGQGKQCIKEYFKKKSEDK